MLQKAVIRRIKELLGNIKPSLRYRFILLTVLLVLIPMTVTGIYLYLIVNKNLVDRTNTDISLFMQQINENISSQFKTVNDTISLIVSNKTIMETISDDSADKDEYESLVSSNRVEKELAYSCLLGYSPSTTKTLKPTLIQRVYLFKANQKYYKFELRFFYNDDEIDEKHKNMFARSLVSNADDYILAPSPDDQTIYFNYNIKSLERLESIGRLILDTDENVLSESYKSVLRYPDAVWYLVDGHGTILSTPDKTFLGQNIDSDLMEKSSLEGIKEIAVHGVTYISAFKNVGKYGMTSIILIPKKQIFSDLTGSIVQYLLIIVVIILLSLLIALFLSLKITNPVQDLIKNIKLVGNGDFQVKMPSYRFRELQELSGVFNDMTGRINYLVNDVYQKQLLLKESELKSLQSQINPHFLFNVLDTIGWYSQAGRTDDIYNIVTSLGQILRANITTTNREKVKIREELEYIEFYVSIQKYRFEDRLQFKLNIEDDCIKDYYIPKLCMQPIVENAIVHGLEEKLGTGTLTINIRTQSDDIVFEVIDDGVGFDTEAVNLDSPQTIQPEKRGKHTHIGISNSNKRIKLLYGEEYGLKLESGINKGTKVTILIPVDRDGG